MSGYLTVPTRAEQANARGAGKAGPLIESVLAVLRGEQLRDLHRAVDMVVVGLGPDVLPKPIAVRDDMDPERRARIERRNTEPLARWRLHVQCPFRLDSPNGPFVGGQDIYREAEPPHEWIEGRHLTGTLFDKRAREGSELEGPPLAVESVSADSGGGFVLGLSESWSITVAPSSAVVDEFWRFFDAAGGDHFVVFDDPEGEQ